MKKPRESVQNTVTRKRVKKVQNQSDERLRRLLDQAQSTSDSRKRALLKDQFIHEFYAK